MVEAGIPDGAAATIVNGLAIADIAGRSRSAVRSGLVRRPDRRQASPSAGGGCALRDHCVLRHNETGADSTRHHADAITAPVSIPLPSPTSHCLARSGRPAAWPPSVRPRRHHADEPRRSLCASKATASSPISVRANTSRRPWRWSSAWATPPNAPPSTTSAIACNDDTIPLRRCGHQDRVCRQFPGRLLVGNPPRQVAGIPRPHRRPASGGAGAR